MSGLGTRGIRVAGLGSWCSKAARAGSGSGVEGGAQSFSDALCNRVLSRGELEGSSSCIMAQA